MMTMKITVDPPISTILARIPDGPKREATLDAVLNRGRYPVQNRVMQNMPVKTGTLRRRTSTTFQHLKATVDVNSRYALAVDQGAAPHQIVPRFTVLLRFIPGGGNNPAARLTGQARVGSESDYVYARAVNHPGQAPQHFMEQGLRDALAEFEAVMKEEIARMVSG